MTLTITGTVIFILLLILYRKVKQIKKLEAHISSLNLIIDSACNIDHKPSNHLSKGIVQARKRRSTRSYSNDSDYTFNDHSRGSSSSDTSYDSSSSSSSSDDTSYSGGGGSFSGSGSSGSWD